MCSANIILHNSCYIDNFLKVGNVFGTAIVFGLIIGTMVGILVLFVKSIKE